jgi:hypothetical protein
VRNLSGVAFSGGEVFFDNAAFSDYRLISQRIGYRFGQVDLLTLAKIRERIKEGGLVIFQER